MSSKSFYNKLELNRPPQLSFKISSPDAITESCKIKSIINKAINVLKEQHGLHQESAALSRLIYLWKMKLRSDKGLKALEKVNRSLLQYLALDLLTVLEEASKKLCEEYGPSRQIMEYILVRLQGFSKLFDNIHNRCIAAALYQKWRFQSGHVLSLAVLGTAIVSRIWVVATYLVKECCKWYTKLKNILPILQPSFHPWLPPDYEFPESITAWLDYPDYLVKPQTTDSKISDIMEKTRTENDSINKSSKTANDNTDFFLGTKKWVSKKSFEGIDFKKNKVIKENALLQTINYHQVKKRKKFKKAITNKQGKYCKIANEKFAKTTKR